MNKWNTSRIKIVNRYSKKSNIFKEVTLAYSSITKNII